MIAGTALQTLLLLIVLYKTNWNKEVRTREIENHTIYTCSLIKIEFSTLN